MLKSPRDAKAEAISATPPQLKAQAQPEVLSTSRFPKPKVLVGEVAAPRAEHYGQQRYLLRSFMQARGLRPSDWARAAGIAPGELLGFLTGRARTIPPASLEKLARTAKCAVEDFFR